MEGPAGCTAQPQHRQSKSAPTKRRKAQRRFTGQQIAPQCSVPAVWTSVLGLALLLALDPVRLGITLLMTSRPRPVPNLASYWVGSLTACVLTLLIPLMVLHWTPIFSSIEHWTAPAANSTVRHVLIGMGVLTLAIAALMALHSLARRHQRAYLPTAPGNTSTLEPHSHTPPAISRLLRRAQDAATDGSSRVRRLLGRGHNAWENGSLWVAWVIGFTFAGAPPLPVLFILATVVGSGAAIGTQFSAVVAFVVAMLAVVEVILASYLVTPTKTQAVLQLLHDWALAHRRQILVAILAVVGVSLLASGMASG